MHWQLIHLARSLWTNLLFFTLSFHLLAQFGELGRDDVSALLQSAHSIPGADHSGARTSQPRGDGLALQGGHALGVDTRSRFLQPSLHGITTHLAAHNPAEKSEPQIDYA